MSKRHDSTENGAGNSNKSTGKQQQDLVNDDGFVTAMARIMQEAGEPAPVIADTAPPVERAPLQAVPGIRLRPCFDIVFRMVIDVHHGKDCRPTIWVPWAWLTQPWVYIGIKTKVALAAKLAIALKRLDVGKTKGGKCPRCKKVYKLNNRFRRHLEDCCYQHRIDLVSYGKWPEGRSPKYQFRSNRRRKGGT